jgi:DNA helicase II / ATP-dependent DNA helicase PcrA
VDAPAELLDALVQAVSQPDIPPDIAEVRIMSLHKSKGLSSPVVIIAGCVEGLLPAFDPELTPAEQQAALEEQRRLFFVGLTRVKPEERTAHLTTRFSDETLVPSGMVGGQLPNP